MPSVHKAPNNTKNQSIVRNLLFLSNYQRGTLRINRAQLLWDVIANCSLLCHEIIALWLFLTFTHHIAVRNLRTSILLATCVDLLPDLLVEKGGTSLILAIRPSLWCFSSPEMVLELQLANLISFQLTLQAIHSQWFFSLVHLCFYMCFFHCSSSGLHEWCFVDSVYARFDSLLIGSSDIRHFLWHQFPILESYAVTSNSCRIRATFSCMALNSPRA